MNYKNKFLEIIGIDLSIQYNKPEYAKCPACGSVKSLFVMNLRGEGIWARCSDCLRSGMDKDWIEHLETDKEMHNFHYLAEKMFRGYSQNMSSQDITEREQYMLRKLGVTNIGYKSKYPFIGVVKSEVFLQDLAYAVKASGFELDDAGPYPLKNYWLVVIPIYGAKFKIEGFTVFNGGKVRDYFAKGKAPKLFYQQGCNHFNVKTVYIAHDFNHMFKFQGLVTMSSNVPHAMLYPFRPNYHHKKPCVSRFVNAKKFLMFTYDKPWGIQLAQHLHRKQGVVTFVSQDIEVTPAILRDNPDLIISAEKHFKNLGRKDELPIFPIQIDEYFDFTVDEDTHSILAKRERTMVPVTEGLIHVDATKDENLFKVTIMKNDLRMLVIKDVPRELFDNIDDFNKLLRAKYTRKNYPKLLEWFRNRDILRTLLILNPETRRHLDGQKKKRQETEAKRKIS
jgi:hypothetical protein